MTKARTWLFILFVFGLCFILCDFDDHTPNDEVFLAQIQYNIFVYDQSYCPSFSHIISKIVSPSTLLVLDRSPPL